MKTIQSKNYPIRNSIIKKMKDLLKSNCDFKVAVIDAAKVTSKFTPDIFLQSEIPDCRHKQLCIVCR